MLLKGAFDALDEGKTGSITFRSIAYGKMGPKLKERLSDEAMESLTEDPAGEVDKEMYAATAGCARARCLHRSRCTIVGLCWVLVSNGAWLTKDIQSLWSTCVCACASACLPRWDAFFGGVMEQEFKTAPEFKNFLVDCLQGVCHSVIHSTARSWLSRSRCRCGRAA